METERVRTAQERALIVIGLLGYGLLFLLAYGTAAPLLFDEPAYLRPVGLLKQHGLSLAFLDNYPEPAGLLHNVLHWLLEPLTGLKPPAVRLVNPVLFVAMTLATYGSLRRLRAERPLASALSLVAIPFVWVLAGMVLTELPAMALASAGTYGLLVGLDLQGRRRGLSLAAAAAGGLLVGLAFLSRAPAVVVVAAAPLLVLTDLKRAPWTVLAFACAAALIPAVVCAHWGGLVSPRSVVHVDAVTFSVRNMVLSISYGAVAMFLLAPRWFAMPAPVVAATVLGVALLNFALDLIRIDAVHSVALHFPAAVRAYWPQAVGSVMLGLAALFLVASARNLSLRRHDPTWMFLCVAMLLLIASTGKITHNFSSRYTGLASGLIVMAAEPYSPATTAKPVRVAIGMAIGILSLLSFYGTRP